MSSEICIRYSVISARQDSLEVSLWKFVIVVFREMRPEFDRSKRTKVATFWQRNISIYALMYRWEPSTLREFANSDSPEVPLSLSLSLFSPHERIFVNKIYGRWTPCPRCVVSFSPTPLLSACRSTHARDRRG